MSTMTAVDDETPAPAEKPKKSLLTELWEIVKTVFFALLIAFVLRVFLFQPFTIPSASMEPTLLEGDYIIVSKWPYGYSRHSLALPWSPHIFSGRIGGGAVERGDIVVFRLPRDDHTDYIKRVVGLPGDRIQVREGLLYINDRPVSRTPMAPETLETAYGAREALRWRETLPGPGGATFTSYDFGPGQDLDDTGVYVVPAGHYFMMGDSRDNSVDSRVAPGSGGVGFVPAENIVGRADIILLSWQPGASLFDIPSWFRVRPSRFFTSLN